MNGIESALYSKLTGDATLMSHLASSDSVYAYAAPENAPLPLIVFFEQADTPTYSLKQRAYDDYLYGVRVTTEDDTAREAGIIDSLVDGLLGDVTLTVDGADTLICRRESGIPPFVETIDGHRYNHTGGSYRIWIGA